MANLWNSLAPLLREYKRMRSVRFSWKFNFGQLLIEAFFDKIGTFVSIQL